MSATEHAGKSNGVSSVNDYVGILKVVYHNLVFCGTEPRDTNFLKLLFLFLCFFRITTPVNLN